MISDKLKLPVYSFTPSYFISGLSPYRFPCHTKQLKENTNEIRVNLFRPEKQEQRSIFESVIPTVTLSNLKREIEKQNRNGTTVAEVAVK